MHPGTELEIENGVDGISIKVEANKPSLTRKRGILVHHGPETITLDTADFVNRQRTRRNFSIAGAAEGGIVAEDPQK